jgi:transposase-like protein
MPRRYPPEVRRQVIELARSGTKVAQLAGEDQTVARQRRWKTFAARVGPRLTCLAVVVVAGWLRVGRLVARPGCRRAP